MCLVGKPAFVSRELEETLHEMFRPFGTIRQYSVESSNDGLYQCFVRLKEPESHELVARTLGCELHDEEVRLEIRLRS